MTKRLFYKPEGAYAADFIPFYTDGFFRLFYLIDWRDKQNWGEGTPWYQLCTHDFINFEEYGEMLPRGTVEEQDLYVFTGSVIEKDNLYHIFYTGHNPHFPEKENPQQAVMHAVSKDLRKWEKKPEHTFFSPGTIYEMDDWRDPYVFYNEEQNEYWMLLAARLKTGPSRRRGCIALCTSKDLISWKTAAPFWAPGLYYTHECPDLFKINDWWYLVYSTFSERSVTHYRMSRNLTGPWTAPENDTFDGRAFYAAKTFSDGNRRFAFGWNPTKVDEKDSNAWQWGGNLVVHEVIQNVDGTLSVKVPETIDRAFNKECEINFDAGLGEWEIDRNTLSSNSGESFSCAAAGKLPDRCKITATMRFSQNTRGFGIMLRTSEDLEKSYYIRFEPGRNRLVFDSWPRRGDLPFWTELERPIDLIPGTDIVVNIFIDDTICETYVNDKIAMSTRMYDLKEGNWGVFINEGSAVFRSVRMFLF